MHTYESIVAWQRADDLAVEVYKVTERFPRAELYGLTSQMRRAAVSVPANIAEGSTRQYLKEYAQFLHMARASLTELAYHVHLSGRLGLVDEATEARLDKMVTDTAAPLYGLMGWAENQIEQGVILNRKPARGPKPKRSTKDRSPKTVNR
jgi:four helix bundle protein